MDLKINEEYLLFNLISRALIFKMFHMKHFLSRLVSLKL